MTYIKSTEYKVAELCRKTSMKRVMILISLITLGTTIQGQNQVNVVINQKAPVVQSNEIYINTTPEKVWKVLTNIENWDEWNNKINKSKLQEKLKVGATFTWKTNGSKIKSKIHTFNTNQVLGWTGKTLGARAIHNWYIEPSEQGTLVKVEESMEGWIVKLMKKKINKTLKEDMTHWLEQLKTKSESGI